MCNTVSPLTFLYPPSERSETGGYTVFTFVCLCVCVVTVKRWVIENDHQLTRTPSTLDQKNLVNFGPQTTEL